MKALIHRSFGYPAEVLEVEYIPAQEPGPGEARLRLLVSPIHNHDFWTVACTYGFKPELPARFRTETVGVVEAVGKGVEHLRPGTRVAMGGTCGV